MTSARFKSRSYTSPTEFFDMCLVVAIPFLVMFAARSSRMSFTLILLAIIYGLLSVKFEACASGIILQKNSRRVDLLREM
jgi:hypothetical protein